VFVADRNHSQVEADHDITKFVDPFRNKFIFLWIGLNIHKAKEMNCRLDRYAQAR
jgi:hypothetical protein